MLPIAVNVDVDLIAWFKASLLDVYARANRFYVGDFALIHYLLGTRPSFFTTYPTLPFYNVFNDFGNPKFPPVFKYMKNGKHVVYRLLSVAGRKFNYSIKMNE